MNDSTYQDILNRTQSVTSTHDKNDHIQFTIKLEAPPSTQEHISGCVFSFHLNGKQFANHDLNKLHMRLFGESINTDEETDKAVFDSWRDMMQYTPKRNTP